MQKLENNDKYISHEGGWLLMLMFMNSDERGTTVKFPQARQAIIQKFKLQAPPGYSISAKLTIILI